MSLKTLEERCSIAIAGNPNSGKTTLFNKLTGLRHKIGNYPGVTVEKKTGVLSEEDDNIQILDLPGTYALSPRSEEEKIASDVIRGLHDDVPPIRGVMCVLDSTTLERSLYLALQIIDTGIQTALILNMSDELERRGAEIDAERLSRILNVPVIPVTASKSIGLPKVVEIIKKWGHQKNQGKKVVPEIETGLPDILTRRKQAKEICAQVLRRKIDRDKRTDKIDQFVMHRVWGPLVFSVVVLLVFQSIFTWAQPAMNLIDGIFSGLGSWFGRVLPPGIINSFVTDGVIAGVGSVLIFLPQILIVFFFIALLEQSGYMARAAMVMDRFFNKIGLQGKSFLPLISSYACAVPGIMAARTIENRRDWLATIFIAPFMTCSARLPVYALLIGAFVPDLPVIKGIIGLKAITLLLLYIVGFLAAMVTALILKSSVLKSKPFPFVLDIPPYRFPSLKTIFLLMWDRSKIFLRRAGTIILGTAIVLWFLISFPQSDGPEPVKQSYAGHIGQFIEPVIKPLGFNWKIGVGLLAAQSAREVIVSSLSTLYSVEDGSDEFSSPLQEALKTDLTPLAAVSLMVFFVFAMQCMSTMAIVRRETGSWKLPILMFIYMNGMAYMASLVVFQVGRLIGFA